MDQLRGEADAFMAQALEPLQLPDDAKLAGGRGEGAEKAPRRHKEKKEHVEHEHKESKHRGRGGDGRRGSGVRQQVGPQRVPAQRPYFAGNVNVACEVAQSPLFDLDGLVDALVPGAELAAEGLLAQMADDELMMFAYAMEQITEAASRKLVTALKTRDGLKDDCLHRGRYLTLLDDAMGRG